MTCISWFSDFALYHNSIKYKGIILWILVQSDTVNDLELLMLQVTVKFHVPVILPCISDLFLLKEVIGHLSKRWA